MSTLYPHLDTQTTSHHKYTQFILDLQTWLSHLIQDGHDVMLAMDAMSRMILINRVHSRGTKYSQGSCHRKGPDTTA